MSSSTPAVPGAAPSSFRFALPTLVAPPSGSPDGTLGATAVPTPGSYPSWWSGVGGPALIVVFTAVGVLALCVVVFLIMRTLRLRQLRDDEEEYGPVTVSRLRKRKLGPKPQIFELPLACQRGDGKENVAKWADMMPISATLVRETVDSTWTKDPEKASAASSSPSSSRPQSYLMPESYTPDPTAHSLGAFNWRYLRPSPHIQDTTLSAPETTALPPPPPETLPENMQVAVAIAMPRPALSQEGHMRETRVHAPAVPPGLGQMADPGVPPEFCLGFTQVRGVRGDE